MGWTRRCVIGSGSSGRDLRKWIPVFATAINDVGASPGPSGCRPLRRVEPLREVDPPTVPRRPARRRSAASPRPLNAEGLAHLKPSPSTSKAATPAEAKNPAIKTAASARKSRRSRKVMTAVFYDTLGDEGVHDAAVDTSELPEWRSTLAAGRLLDEKAEAAPDWEAFRNTHFGDGWLQVLSPRNLKCADGRGRCEMCGPCQGLMLQSIARSWTHGAMKQLWKLVDPSSGLAHLSMSLWKRSYPLGIFSAIEMITKQEGMHNFDQIIFLVKGRKDRGTFFVFTKCDPSLGASMHIAQSTLGLVLLSPRTGGSGCKAVGIDPPNELADYTIEQWLKHPQRASHFCAAAFARVAGSVGKFSLSELAHLDALSTSPHAITSVIADDEEIAGDGKNHQGKLSRISRATRMLLMGKLRKSSSKHMKVVSAESLESLDLDTDNELLTFDSDAEEEARAEFSHIFGPVGKARRAPRSRSTGDLIEGADRRDEDRVRNQVWRKRKEPRRPVLIRHGEIATQRSIPSKSEGEQRIAELKNIKSARFGDAATRQTSIKNEPLTVAKQQRLIPSKSEVEKRKAELKSIKTACSKDPASRQTTEFDTENEPSTVAAIRARIEQRRLEATQTTRRHQSRQRSDCDTPTQVKSNGKVKAARSRSNPRKRGSTRRESGADLFD